MANKHVVSQQLLNFYTKQIFSLPITSFRYTIYKIPSSGRIEYYDWIGSNLYHYGESASQFKWSITQNKDSFAGYACQKAVTNFAGRRFEAWFTREIPVSDGPYKFAGLPGLIIKLNDVQNQFIFELISTGKLNNYNIEMPLKKSTLVTREVLRKGMANYQANLLNKISSTDNTGGSDNRKNLAERARRRNNQLELR